MKCAFCDRVLPEPNCTHITFATGRMGIEEKACLTCIARLKLKITKLEKA